MKINKEDLKWPQIDAAMKFIYDNVEIYRNLKLDHIYEWGVYHGNSLKKIINYLENNTYLKSRKIWGFDSFNGLPETDEIVFKKFKKGNYDISKEGWTVSDVYDYCNYYNLKLIQTKFSDATVKKDMCPALLVHLDCDLYDSTIDALKFMFSNKLIGRGTLLAFDEFKVGNYKSEQEAFYESSQKYGFGSQEIWHNTYYDKDFGNKIRQSVWEITAI